MQSIILIILTFFSIQQQLQQLMSSETLIYGNQDGINFARSLVFPSDFAFRHKVFFFLPVRADTEQI